MDPNSSLFYPPYNTEEDDNALDSTRDQLNLKDEENTLSAKNGRRNSTSSDHGED